MSASPSLDVDELCVVDPATLEVVGRVPVTPPEALEEIVAEARIAAARWGAEPLEERARLLRSVARELLASSDDVAHTIVAETGKPVIEAMTSELLVCLDALTWLSRRVGSLLRDERVPFPQLHLRHKRAWLHYEPLGVVGIVAPWNFPLGVPLTQTATAVAAGNAVVLKPSELTPLTGAWIEELFRRAGAPPGLVRAVQGPGHSVGDALVRHRGIAKVVFTGSTDVGRVVGTRCAERLCPVTLELGGKDPMLVLDDADLDRAVEGALWGAFTNAGQVCSGIERIYVASPLHDAFLERLAARAATLRLGRGNDPRTEMGPLIREQERTRIEDLVADAVEHGAEILCGGSRPRGLGLRGWFHEATVLAGEAPGARLHREEIFGPVVTVVKIDDESDGIARANDSAFGLGASVWTRDRDRARRVAARLQAGSVWMNDHAYSYGACQAPWGGVKESGHGRTHSKHGLYGMSSVRYVDSDAGRLSPPWWYPYSERGLDGFRGTLGVLYGDRLVDRARDAWRYRHGLVELGRRAVRRP